MRQESGGAYEEGERRCPCGRRAAALMKKESGGFHEQKNGGFLKGEPTKHLGETSV